MSKPVENESELEKTFDYIKKLFAESKDFFLLLVLLFLIYIFFQVAPQMLKLVLLSYGISMLLRPVVAGIRMRRIKLSAGLIAVMSCVMILLVLVSLLLWIFPPLVANLAETLSTSSVSLPERFVRQLERVSGFRIPKMEELVAQLIGYGKKHLTQENLGLALTGLSQTIFAGYSFGLTILNLLLVPVFVFYISQDWNKLNRALSRVIPASYREAVHEFAVTVDDTIVRYSKAQFFVASILVVLYSIALLIAGVPNALPIGILSGMLSVIPYAGLFVGLFTAILMNLSADPAGASIIAPVIAFVSVQALEGNFITPKIMSESTGLHPGVVLFSILVGGSAFGLIGVIFAVPAVATIRNILASRKKLA